MTMTSFPTPVRGLVCNLGPAKKDDKDPKDNIPSVEQAKKQTEQAKIQEKAAIEKEQQQQMFTTAMDKSRQADESTKAALKYKPDSTQGKKAHHAAAVAHKDAHKHMTGVGGEKSGLANDQRAAAERKAAKHKKMAETHVAMAEGFGGPGGTGKGPTKNATGCPGVGVVINTWSDKAREAAAAARHHGGIARQASAVADMKQTTLAHNDAMHSHIAAKTAMQEAAYYHDGDAKASYKKEAEFHGKQAKYHSEKMEEVH